MAKSDEGAPSGNDAPLLIEGPKALSEDIGPIIDLEPLRAFKTDENPEPQAADMEAADEAVADEPIHEHSRLTTYARLAAGVAIALAIGALAGAAGTVSLMRDDTASIAAHNESRALRQSVAQLDNELAALKSGIASAQRSASTQFGKLADRLDRAEKAQAEPSAKLAKIQESLDRLDHRQQQAAATPAPTPAPDITGSINAPKEQSRPPVAEGWKMRDFYAGRAVVQSRNGTLFEVGPGSNLPGLGRVETIKRENGQVVVVAQNGTIAGSVAQRRPAYYLPYRY